MASGDGCCFGLFFLIFGLILIYSSTQRYLLSQKIKNTPTSKVRSAAVGLVELNGAAVCKNSLISPLSKQKCVYYRISGEYYVSGKNGGWRNLYLQQSHEQFYIQDETGKMLVDAEGGEIDIPFDFQSSGYLTDKGFLGLGRKKLDQKALDFIGSDQQITSLFGSRSSSELRLTEYFIAEKDPIYVLGTATIIPESKSRIAYENLVVKKGNDKVMYVSDKGERKITSDMRNTEIISLVVGFVMAAIGLFAILN